MRAGLRRCAAIRLVALLGAACGSGKATPGDGSNGSGGTGGSGAESKSAFVSYDMLQGNMGIEGADAACQKDADVWFQETWRLKVLCSHIRCCEPGPGALRLLVAAADSVLIVVIGRSGKLSRSRAHGCVPNDSWSQPGRPQGWDGDRRKQS